MKTTQKAQRKRLQKSKAVAREMDMVGNLVWLARDVTARFGQEQNNRDETACPNLAVTGLAGVPDRTAAGTFYASVYRVVTGIFECSLKQMTTHMLTPQVARRSRLPWVNCLEGLLTLTPRRRRGRTDWTVTLFVTVRPSAVA